MCLAGNSITLKTSQCVLKRDVKPIGAARLISRERERETVSERGKETAKERRRESEVHSRSVCGNAWAKQNIPRVFL